jgi:uncharacterized protein (DUF2126 family)
LTTKEIDALLNEAFRPAEQKLKIERQLIEEYYESGLPLGKFAMSKNINMDQLLWLLKKYGLPRKSPVRSSDEQLEKSDTGVDNDQQIKTAKRRINTTVTRAGAQ